MDAGVGVVAVEVEEPSGRLARGIARPIVALHHASINTAAAGGNATLMTLQ